jgi:hypothetical protein
MAHFRKTYKFECEAEAAAFAESQRSNKSPIEDKYVTGPSFMGETEIFKNWPGLSSETKNSWWEVNIEIYT